MPETAIAASRPLHWQAAFTMKTYTANFVADSLAARIPV